MRVSIYVEYDINGVLKSTREITKANGNHIQYSRTKYMKRVENLEIYHNETIERSSFPSLIMIIGSGVLILAHKKILKKLKTV